jgi:putative membrane protein insertion efficiency factor
MTAKIFLMLIRGYQLTLSPLVGGSCRFEPSCSVYASEAIRMHGAARGSWLAMKRLARCHPFGSYGFDPVSSASTGRRTTGRRTTDHGSRI